MITNYATYREHLNLYEQKYAPKDFFTKGDFSLLTKGRRVSVVGSRAVTDEGRERAQRLVAQLVSHEVTVVSGLAQGVDTVAHESTIAMSGRTIAVLGTPLSQMFPCGKSWITG